MSNPYNTIQHSEFARLPTPHPVRRIAGVLVKLFDPKRGRSDLKGLTGHGQMHGVLQNAFLRDPFSDTEVKVMFSDYYFSPSEFQGGFIAIEALTTEDIVWKAQVGANSRPLPNKVEISSSVRFLHLVDARSYRGPDSLPQDYRSTTSVTPELPFGSPPKKAPERISAPLPQVQHSHGDTNFSIPALNPEQVVKNAAALARMTLESFSSVMLPEKEETEGQVKVSPTLFESLVTVAFTQMLTEGVHNRLTETKTLPEPRPNLDRIKAMVEEFGEEVVRGMLNRKGLQIGSNPFEVLSEEALAPFLTSVATAGKAA